MDESIATAIANRMRAASAEKMIRVYENGFAGAAMVFATSKAREAAMWLREHGAYKGMVTMDGGYYVVLPAPDNRTLSQGEAALDAWIAANEK